MWDRLLIDCNVATMEPRAGDPLGVMTNAAIGIQDGRIVRIGKRTELAGFRATEVVPLDGAWVTPGLIDCHTHLVFGGDRADEHAMRRAGASYEDIAKAGGGIASTVAKTRAASATDLISSARRRLRALMAGGVTTVEIKSGYGLDTANEMRLLNAAKALGKSEPVRVVGTLLALHALPPEQQWTLSQIGAPDTFTRLPAQSANFNFFRHYLDSPSSGEFVRDDRFFMNAIRENGNVNAPTNPDIGHFHVYGEEFWFIIEGTVGFLKEGAPYKVANAGDIVYNPPMRWHRMGTDGSNNGTRIAINGYRFGAHHLPYPTNTTSDQQIPFSILVTPPTTTPTLSPVTSNQRTVKLTAYPHANSTEDGMDYSEYWLDGAVTPTRYTGPFQISGDGRHTLVYRSVDEAGNVENLKKMMVVVQ